MSKVNDFAYQASKTIVRNLVFAFLGLGLCSAGFFFEVAANTVLVVGIIICLLSLLSGVLRLNSVYKVYADFKDDEDLK